MAATEPWCIVLEKQLVLDKLLTDLEGLCSYFLNFNYDALLSSLDIEFVWSSLKDIILHAISLYTPSVKISFQFYPKWFSSTIRLKINILRSLCKKCKRNPSNTNTSRLHSAQLQLESEMQQVSCTYEFNLVKNFAHSNDSKIYRYAQHFNRISGMTMVSYFWSLAVNERWFNSHNSSPELVYKQFQNVWIRII